MIELMMLEMTMSTVDSDMPIIYEDASETISNICTKISATIRKFIVEMNNFVKQLQITIESAAFTVKMKRILAKVEKDLKNGKGSPISIVDMEAVTKLYKKDIIRLRKEVQSIASDLKKFSIRGNVGKINRYMENKTRLREEIEEMLVELELATQKRVVVKPEMAKKEIDEIMKRQRLFMTEYTRIIYDFERLVSEFEKVTAVAETDYAVREAVRDYSGPIQQLKVGATKLLRKSVFAITAITGVVI